MNFVFRSSRCALIALLLAFSSGSVRGGDVLTQHNNNARTGAILDEKILNTTNVRSQRFGKLWTLFADGQVVAQPLYVSKLAIDTSANPGTPKIQGTFNAVILATMHNTIYVYDADKETVGQTEEPFRCGLDGSGCRGPVPRTSLCGVPTILNGEF